MKNKMKRFISFLTSLTLAAGTLAALPMSAGAAVIGSTNKQELNTTIDNDSTTTEINSTVALSNVSSSDIAEGGKFRVIYTYTDTAPSIVLYLNGTTQGWKNAQCSFEGTTSESEIYRDFSYDALASAYGTSDFSDLSALGVQSWSGTATIKSVEWIPPASYGESIKSWEFTSPSVTEATDSASGKVDEWTYSNTYNAGTVTIGTDTNQTMLKVTEDFTSATTNYGYSSFYWGNTSATDYSDMACVSFDYYAKEGELPSKLNIQFAGAPSGSWTSGKDTTVYPAGLTPETETVTIDGETYYKYHVAADITLPETDNTESTIRATFRRITIKAVRDCSDSSSSNRKSYTVYYDNINIQKLAPTYTVTLGNDLAVYNTEITASATGFTSPTYQWYTASSYTGEGTAVDGATSETYKPTMDNIGAWLYCTVSEGETTVTSERVRIAAGTKLKETTIKCNNTTIGDYHLCALSNTTAYSGGAGALDASKIAKTGYFYLEYTGEISGTPQFQWGTWSSETKSSATVSAYETGTKDDGTKWAKYKYEDFVTAWGDEDMTDFKAVRVYYSADDESSLTIKSASWFGPPVTYGELGTPITLRGSYTGYQYLFTRHVGGTELDATQLKEDDEFYVEYAETDASETVNLIAQSHSANADGTDVKSTYATVAPYETGKTGSGRYARYKVSDIKTAFGTKFRYIDGLRIATASGNKLTANASLYLFEGNGDLVDDISQQDASGKTYDDAVNVPWTKYDDTTKDGIAVIGASISQNPLVTAASLEGKPYYWANGGWNAILDRTDVVTYGIGSQTTDDIAARFHEVLDYDYKQIIIQCGNNDLGNYSTAAAAANAEYANYCKMMDMVKAKMTEKNTTIPVYIIAINPVGQSSTTTNQKIPTVVQKLKTLESTYSFVTYIDKVYDEFLDTSFNGKTYTDFVDTTAEGYSTPYVNSSLVMTDGLHPVGEGYAIHAKYLKPLLSSTSTDTDATLASLSYRMSDSFDIEEAKKVVTGFESGKAANTDGYTVTLPAETNTSASFRLYTTASNIAKATDDTSNATVKVNNADVTGQDDYGNDYTTITLSNGLATASVVVTAADNTTTQTYTVNFKVDGVEPTTSPDVSESPNPSDSPEITKGVTIDKNLAIYNEKITATAAGLDGTVTYKWYLSSDVAGTDAAEIEGAESEAFTPDIEQIGGWIYCTATDGNEVLTSDKVRVAASSSEKTIELPVSETTIGNYDLALLNNVTTEYGKIDVLKWAVGGYIHIEFTGISDGEPSALPQLELGTWSVDGKESKDIYAAKHGANGNTVWAEYAYEDIVNAWYSDADFTDVKAIRVHYSGSDKANLTITSAEYIGPTLSYGDLGTAVTLRGSYSGYQYLFTRHVGGKELDATTLKEDDFFYVEYAEADANETVNLVAQCHSAKADGTNVKSTYAVIAPSETGKTGSGRYAKYTVEDIKSTFGEKFRYIDGLRIATMSGNNLTANASLYLFKGTGTLVDDISADDYADAVNVPWTLYDNDDNLKAKDGIAVIGASITQNPLVTSLAMSGKPFYSPNGGWSPMLDRTDVATYGIGSQTTDDIAARFHEVLDYNYKQIIIQCGNNDLGAYSDADAAAQAEYNNYKTMLNMVKEKNATLDTPIRVHIISLNPVNSETTNAKIPTVIAKLKELVAESDYSSFADYSDVYDEFKDETTGFSKTNLVMTDGLHPVAEGYAIYAKYLKPLLATNDDADSTLASLSYRMSDDFSVSEAKKVVPGFVSGKAADENGYNVELTGTAADATFRLYTTASNTGQATVTVNGTAVTSKDEYDNEYTNITLVDRAATAEVVVTPINGTASTYTINFIADGVDLSDYIYVNNETKSMEATDESINGWTAYVQYDVNYSDKIYPGAVIEFDVTVGNDSFNNIQLLLNNAWANLAGDATSGLTVQKDQFDDNVYRVVYTYEGTSMDSFTSLQIKAATNTDYRGTISISNVRIKNGDAPEVTYPLSESKAVYNTAITFPNNESDTTTTYTYQWYKRSLPNVEGSAITDATGESFTPTIAELGTFIYCVRTADGVTETSDTVPVFVDGTKKTYTLSDEELTVNANYGLLASPILTSLHGGAFNPITIKPYGQFKVTYSGDADIQLILSNYHGEGENNKWIAISPSEKGDGYAVFDYAACLEQNGQDFTDIEYINVTNISSTTPVTVTKVEWEGYPVSYGDLGEQLSYITTSATEGILGYIYTEHVGGEFRAQDMKEDSYFYLEYKGTEVNAVDLAFSSVSGAQGGQTTYAVITPSESGMTGSNYYAKYTVEDLRRQFGDNFARLDQINITTHATYDNNGNVTSQATAENAALYYFAGAGDDVETNKNDVSWANKPKTGIAFIGDSIVQNPLVTDDALSGEPYNAPKGDWNAILGRNDIANYGIGGETSVHISNRFYQLLLDGYDYNTIVMWFGVNDTGLVNSAEEHAARVTGNYKKALDQVKGMGKKVYVLSILPTGGDFYPTQQDRITTTNTALKAMCESDEYKDFVTYVDLYDAFLGEDGTANSELFFDNILHPNGKGYAVVASILNQYLDEPDEYYCNVSTDTDGNITYESSYSETADYDIFVAAYNKDGVLVGIEKNKASGSFNAASGIETVKAFFWEKDSMKPVSDAGVIIRNVTQ